MVTKLFKKAVVKFKLTPMSIPFNVESSSHIHCHEIIKAKYAADTLKFPDHFYVEEGYILHNGAFVDRFDIKSKTASAALEQAFTSFIAPEKFPCCVLFIGLNPTRVDVNVHPAKLEVKFTNEKPVFESVYYAVRLRAVTAAE